MFAKEWTFLLGFIPKPERSFIFEKRSLINDTVFCFNTINPTFTGLQNVIYFFPPVNTDLITMQLINVRPLTVSPVEQVSGPAARPLQVSVTKNLGNVKSTWKDGEPVKGSAATALHKPSLRSCLSPLGDLLHLVHFAWPRWAAAQPGSAWRHWAVGGGALARQPPWCRSDVARWGREGSREPP